MQADVTKKQHPITMSGESVPGILADLKTQTRRVVKQMHPKTPVGIGNLFHGDIVVQHKNGKWNFRSSELKRASLSNVELRCPYGGPGDLLWVKEAWTEFEFDDVQGDRILYRADYPSGEAQPIPDIFATWRSSRFMPKWAARIWLEITDVRVQRVQEISVEDVYTEGFVDPPLTTEERQAYAAGGSAMLPDKATPWFISTWDSLNAKRGYSWESNPWVWALTFKRAEAPTRTHLKGARQ